MIKRTNRKEMKQKQT